MKDNTEKSAKFPTTISAEAYLKERVEDQINWYSRKAGINKQWHNWLRAIIIIASSAIPFIAGIEFKETYKNVLLGGLGSLIAILSGMAGLMKFQEKWTEYRTTSEALKHEKFRFQSRTEPYDLPDDDEAYRVLVSQVEKLISAELSQWNEYVVKANK